MATSLFTSLSRLLLLVFLGILLSLPGQAATPQPRQQPETSKEQPAAYRYWINSRSGKTHNQSCRYYANCNGYPSNTGSGNNCKICGGNRK